MNFPLSSWLECLKDTNREAPTFVELLLSNISAAGHNISAMFFSWRKSDPSSVGKKRKA